MRRNGWSWQGGIVSTLALALSLDIALSENPTLAQVVPDRTLGRESSVVNQIDALNERIDGGATRGENLFHSFQEFNVNEGRGVYFANPEGITNILSRVTGGNPSHILGRLGVLGGANLFLLNPNGILFGANSSLDISGSFVATTADGIQLGENGFFSATEPQKSRLLSVSPGATFFEQAANTPGVIVNRGNLAVGKDLTFSADNLDLQGQLVAGRNLTLQALNTVQIRDSKFNPFVAAAKGDLLVQGNQKIDIFALNHPASGLFSGGDLVLRSTTTVGGDAHYWSGGNFRIEQLNGKLGDLYSPYDPVIRSLGDVSFDSYIGTSLHILAVGKVEISGFVQILGADPVNGLVEIVTLSDGTTVAIDGKSEPTLDIRAGVDPDVVEENFFDQNNYYPFDFFNFIVNPNIGSSSSTAANISINNITFISLEDRAGRVFLSNQYQPNTSLNTLSGKITIGSINLSGGGNVTLDSRSGIALNGKVNASAFLSNGGNVTLLAEDKIATSSSILAQGLSGGNIIFNSGGEIVVNGAIDTFGSLRNGGNVTFKSGGAIALNGTVNTSGSSGNGGNITLLAEDHIITSSNIQTQGSLGGNIFLKSQSDILAVSSSVFSNRFAPTSNSESGSIHVTARNLTLKNGAILSTSTFAPGNGGTVKIQAESLTLTNNSQIVTNTFGTGNAGDISVQVKDSVSLANRSGILSSVDQGGIGTGGDISIRSRSLSLIDGSQVQAILFRAENGLPGGRGQAGNIEVNATDFVNLSGISPDGFSSGFLASTERGASGSAGTITVTTGDFRVADGAVVNTLTANEGNANSITINANTFEATGGGQVVTATRSSGQAGDITLNIADQTTISGSDPNFSNRLARFGEDIVNNQGAESGLYANTAPNSTGQGGDIILNTDSLNISDRAQITARSQGQSNAGTITIKANGAIDSTNSDITTSAEQASGGAINLTAQDIRLRGDSDIRTNVNVGAGGGGDITLNANSIIAYDDSDILAFARDGRGGNITLGTPVFFGSQFQSAPEGTDPNSLDGNNRVDINASGAVGGVISLPDLTFIQNNLTELPANVINTEDLIANSCVVQNQKQAGTFIITGSGGLPVRPGDASISTYPTGEVRTVPDEESSRSWQIGDSIVEPQGVYRLSNGQLVMSRECR